MCGGFLCFRVLGWVCFVCGFVYWNFYLLKFWWGFFVVFVFWLVFLILVWVFLVVLFCLAVLFFFKSRDGKMIHK